MSDYKSKSEMRRLETMKRLNPFDQRLEAKYDETTNQGCYGQCREIGRWAYAEGKKDATVEFEKIEAKTDEHYDEWQKALKECGALKQENELKDRRIQKQVNHIELLHQENEELKKRVETLVKDFANEPR